MFERRSFLWLSSVPVTDGPRSVYPPSIDGHLGLLSLLPFEMLSAVVNILYRCLCAHVLLGLSVGVELLDLEVTPHLIVGLSCTMATISLPSHSSSPRTSVLGGRSYIVFPHSFERGQGTRIYRDQALPKEMETTQKTRITLYAADSTAPDALLFLGCWNFVKCAYSYSQCHRPQCLWSLSQGLSEAPASLYL